MDHKTEQDAGLLEQAATMLEEHAEEQRTRGNCSAAEGAACSAHAIRRLAPALLRAGHGCLAQPVCWIRFCSDGSTEGPIMHSRICEVRKTSGAWTPLYAGAAPAAVAGSALGRVYPSTEQDNHRCVGCNRTFADASQEEPGDTSCVYCGNDDWREVAAPALEAPATPSGDEEAAFTKWFQGEQGKPYQGMWEFARAAWMARSASAGIVAAALTRLDAIYRDETDCDEPPKRPDWLVNALHLAAAAPQAPAAPAVDALSQAVRDVLAERRRQVEAEGYDTEHDDAHVMGEIGALAALYLMPDGARDWDAASTTYGATLGQALLPEDWTMPTMGEDRRRDVVKGIACGLAELERLDRAAQAKEGGEA